MLHELRRELEQFLAGASPEEFHPRTLRGEGLIELKGQRLVDFTSWDFFNLNSDPKVKRALQKEVESNGIGAGASRLSSGTSPVHLSCEHRLAQFVGAESCVLFSSTNQAVLSLVAGLISERDCVLVDETLQTPVVDASFLVHADVLNFRASDPDSLLKILDHTKPYRRKFLFLRTVSPTTGAVANLAVLAEYASKHGVQLMLDEGYGIGILGMRGAGAAEKFNVSNKAFCIYGSLSKAIGVYGAFVAGPKILSQYLVNRSQTFRSENVLPPCLAAAIETGIGVIEMQPAARERLRSMARKLRRGLKDQGFNVDAETDSPIVGVSGLSRANAQDLAQGLFSRGFLVEVYSGGVPRSDHPVVRLLVNIAHKPEQIDSLLEACVELKKRSIEKI